ncbi:NAD(P)H-dependent oxidoreductase [Luteipulveratus halotolerans]|uniref:Flavodoxin-like fold domain-containing protein n=1 Tax=Luteipulveratus halotolerans TaxID=1631356 RepID=A0A0L6CLV0_9MICO|nr:NAD(P)H-dependent oxidoreductase [Luteipulveratus halotolerans]KNX38610.1 hypothetical protein VV01_18035 [Luteipulveratus halotolerans]
MHRFLWISAHPDPQSLTASLRRDAVKHLADGGHEVVESDLYAMGWDPVLSDADLGPVEPGPLVARQKAATLGGTLSEDIRIEQDKLRAADTVMLQFPLWWYGVPAIMKGWFDRVLTSGFAFWLRDPATGRVRKYGDGGLVGRRVLTVVAAGDRETALGARGISGHVEDVLWPVLHGTVHYTGMEPLRPHLIASSDRVDGTSYDAERARLVARLDGLDGESPIPFRTLASGEYDEQSRLRDEHSPDRTGLAIHRTTTSPT